MQDTNEWRAERSGETMSKLSEGERAIPKECQERGDKGGMTAPAGLDHGQCRISNKARGKQCLVKFF